METKSIVRRGRSKAAPANRVQFNSSDENPAKDEEIEAQVEEAPVEKQKRKTTRAKKVTEKVSTHSNRLDSFINEKGHGISRHLIRRNAT